MKKSAKTVVALGMAATLVAIGFAGPAETATAKKTWKEETSAQLAKTPNVVSGSQIEWNLHKPKREHDVVCPEKVPDVVSGSQITPETAQPEDTSSIKSKAVCTASGKICIKFSNQVEWDEDVTVSLTDADGVQTIVEVVKKNERMIAVAGTGMVKGEKYTVTVNGVKAAGADEYTSVSCEFTAKKLKTCCKAKKITKKIKAKKNTKIVVQCKGTVKLKDATVTVTDEDNNDYASAVVSKSKGNIKVRVAGLKKKEKYTVIIDGVKAKKEANYAAVTSSFATK